MIASSLIIENTNKTPAWVRVRDWVLSALVWALYFYMIREVFIDLYVLFHESFDWMFDGTGRPSVPEISRLLSTLRVYAGVILGNGWLLILWGLYNQIRFRGLRQPAPDRLVTVDDLATLYQLPARDIAIWQSSRVLTMRHGADGTLETVIASAVTRDPHTPPSETAATLHAASMAGD